MIADTAAPTTLTYDALIIGAGPIGLATAIACSREGLRPVVLDKGCLANNVFQFPPSMEFFSTPELLEIGGHPFVTARAKPTREEALSYYRQVARAEDLDARSFEQVERVGRDEDGFRVEVSRTRDTTFYNAKAVVIATGYYDNPNLMGLPGEKLGFVSHYYDEAHPWTGRDVLVVGGQNSAVEAALDLYRHGARVTLVHRRAELGDSIKYWVKPDILNRIEEGAITVHFNTIVGGFEPGVAHLRGPDGPQELLVDRVYALTGYHPDTEFFESCGIEVDAETLCPTYDPKTYETNVPGLFVAGSLTGGRRSGRIFIENGREHAPVIAAAIAEAAQRK